MARFDEVYSIDCERCYEDRKEKYVYINKMNRAD